MRKQIISFDLEKKVDEGIYNDYKDVIKDFFDNFVKSFIFKLGITDSPKIVEIWGNYLLKNLGDDVYSLVANELKAAIKKNTL
jgi:hypothetical protein